MGRLIEIFGKSGSGKTLAIINLVKESLKQGNNTLIITDDLHRYVNEIVNNDETIGAETLEKCRLLNVYTDGIDISKISQVLNEYSKEINISEEDVSKFIIIDCDRFRENIDDDFIKRLTMLAKSLDNCKIVLSRQYNKNGIIAEKYHDVVYSVNKKRNDVIEVTNVAPWNLIVDDNIFNFKNKELKFN